MASERPLPSIRERDIFFEAVEKPTPAERSAYLIEACGGDQNLLESIKSLLEAHETGKKNGQALDDGCLNQNAGSAAKLAPGTEVGDFLIINHIGPGGCGEIYKALQRSVEREVALKVIRPGKDTQAVIERFNQEKKTLGALNHPNIVTVMSGGTHDGQPYFAMELVAGSAHITHYADAKNLTIQKRLSLFLQVCEAVEFAHNAGVIHRDLKPANVLVTEKPSGEPLVKVIDFGIAKVVNNGLPLAYATLTGQPIGTPAYMSPEQTGETDDEVSESTDIYSLGVLLYELLVGKLPLEIKGAGKEQMKIIREATPLPPSKRINERDDFGFLLTAQKRGLDPAQLEKLLKGDLDRIVMRCLAKKPQDRFYSVEQLALEIKTHCKKTIQEESAPTIIAPVIAKGKTWFRLSLASAIFLISLIAGWMIFHSGQMKIHAPDAAHGEAAKCMYWILDELKSPNSDISEVEAHLTPNAKQFWQWLLAQEWFAKKPTPRITGYEGDENHPVVDIVFEYPAGSDHGNETMSVKFLSENGVVKLDEVALLEMKGAHFGGMPLSLVVTNRAEADAKFARLNPQLKGVDFMQLAKQ